MKGELFTTIDLSSKAAHYFNGARNSPAAIVKAIDWEAIEAEYRIGVLSIRQVAKQHNIAESCIRKRAKKKGWVRDLTKRAKKAVRAELVRTEVRTPTRVVMRTEQEIVEASTQTVAHVVRMHRKDIAHGRAIVELLFEQLNFSVHGRAELQQEIFAETKDEAKMARRTQMFRAIALPTHATTVRDLALALALKHIVGLERQAFNLDNKLLCEPEENTLISQKVVQQILNDLHTLSA